MPSNHERDFHGHCHFMPQQTSPLVLLASGPPSMRVSVRETADERALRLLTPPLDGMPRCDLTSYGKLLCLSADYDDTSSVSEGRSHSFEDVSTSPPPERSTSTMRTTRTPRPLDSSRLDSQVDSLPSLMVAILVLSIAIVVVVLTVFDVDDIRGARWSALYGINSAAYRTAHMWASTLECSTFVLGRVARALVSGFKRGYSA
jgi:hypothetical protein